MINFQSWLLNNPLQWQDNAAKWSRHHISGFIIDMALFDISLHPLFWWVTAYKIYPSSGLDDSTAVSWIMWRWGVPTSSRVKHPCIISELALYIRNSAFVDSANHGLCTVEPLYWIRSACDWTCVIELLSHPVMSDSSWPKCKSTC